MSTNTFLNLINQLSSDSVFINETIESEPDACSILLIIPGFSSASYDRNYQTLFGLHKNTLDTSNFKSVFMIKFSDEIHNLHQQFFKDTNQIINFQLENALYKKCADILLEKLDSLEKYTVLAKSAGAGPAIFLCNTVPKQFLSLYLFAPGVKYISKTIKHVVCDFPKTTVGWNASDNKVKMVDVWNTLEKVLPNCTLLCSYYQPNTSVGFDSSHEINFGFLSKVI